MARTEVGRGDVAQHVATPLPVMVTAAGLVSAVRFGDDAVRRRDPQAAQWDAIRSHYQEVADWIDLDATGERPTAPPTAIDAIGRLSRADVVDFLGILNCSASESVSRDDVGWWLSGAPDYWITAGESAETVTTAHPEFRRDYEHAATIGPLNIYRRCAPAATRQP
jgi:hypothetical protein